MQTVNLVEQQEIEKANEYVSYWQEQLRLDHVDIEVILMRKEENDNLAQCTVAFGRHRQKILVRHPADRSDRDREDFRRDLEVCVVHELLHTKEATWRDHPSVDDVFNKDRWLNGLHEDSLDAMAEALVRTRRGITR